jgi:hypothetical protein
MEKISWDTKPVNNLQLLGAELVFTAYHVTRNLNVTNPGNGVFLMGNNDKCLQYHCYLIT